jgi:hypothetical protein
MSHPTRPRGPALPAWPDQVRLVGQAAAPEGPLDMRTMYLMHHAFRRDLAAFASAAATTPVEDRGCWRALERRWKVFAFALHRHHTGEDTGLWPILRDRADDESRALLVAMEAEHEEIDPLLSTCAAGFARLAARADEDARAALAVRLVAARERLAAHLRHEETEAIALMQAVLRPAEWEEVERSSFRAGLGLRELVAVVPWALVGVPDGVRRDLFARSGPAHRILWLLTRRRHAGLDRRAFRHLG